MMNKATTAGRLASVAGIALCVALLMAGCRNSAPAPHQGHDGQVKLELPSPDAVVVTNQNVPHFHENPEEAKPFPKTLDPAQFTDPAVRQAYTVARRIPAVLAQQPCYCFCDKGFGHGSLLDCHIDDHSAG